MATCVTEDGESSVNSAAELSAMFPNLEWELLQSVLHNHGGSVAGAVHYLMAVMGDVEELPVSEDIGGLPQVVPDDGPTSGPTSPTGSVLVELEDTDQSHMNGHIVEAAGNSPDVNASLPTYRDVTEGGCPPPPSYDSLQLSPSHPVSSPHDTPHRPPTTSPTPVVSLARRIRIRRREKSGYRPCGSINH